MRACLFSSYFLGGTLPPHVRRYLLELRRHFDRVVLLANDDNDLTHERAWFEQHGVEWVPVRNEGYDFGMWHKALGQLNPAGLERLALVNDSCVLFTRLDEALQWMEHSPLDLCGITDSNQRAYHVQSYFLYFKKPAIPAVGTYFAEHGVVSSGFYGVIGTYEVGLSQFLLRSGFSIGARYGLRESGFRGNPSMELIVPLLKAGMPMIKRKAFRIGFRYAYLRCQMSQIFNGYCPDPWSYASLIGDRYKMTAAEIAALFGPLLQTDRLSQALNTAWRWIFRLYSALRLPTRRVDVLGR